MPERRLYAHPPSKAGVSTGIGLANGGCRRGETLPSSPQMPSTYRCTRGARPEFARKASLGRHRPKWRTPDEDAYPKLCLTLRAPGKRARLPGELVLEIVTYQLAQFHNRRVSNGIKHLEALFSAREDMGAGERLEVPGNVCLGASHLVDKGGDILLPAGEGMDQPQAHGL